MSQTPPRLFVEADLTAGGAVDPTPAQAHYLLTVMRRAEGDEVWLFNGRDGEWRAKIGAVAKKRCEMIVTEPRRVQGTALDLWLVFAPVKNARLEFLVEKATELGASRLIPVLTERTIVRRLNLDRLRAHAIEAAEQSNRLDVPVIDDVESLDAVLDHWPAGRRLIYADEIGPASLARDALKPSDARISAVLIGPEGGFSLSERDRILKVSDVVPISLGPRLLRADTAALTALVLVQAAYGEDG